MSTTSFSINWDYRCPFARNANEHVVTALEGGADWDVSFVPFSLGQVHVEEGGTSVWDDPGEAPSLMAMEAALVVRDRFPEAFFSVHRAFFAARHDEARDLRDESVVRAVLATCRVDPEEVLDAVHDGAVRKLFRDAHESAVDDHSVFGVPTFVVGDQVAFVRIMTRPNGDAAFARKTIEDVLDVVAGHPELNEIKHTSIPR